MKITYETREETEPLFERLRSENNNLRAVALSLIQHQNGGNCIRQNGAPCADTGQCACSIELADLLEEIESKTVHR